MTGTVQLVLLAQKSVSDDELLSYGQSFARRHCLAPPEAVFRQTGRKPCFTPGSVHFSISHSADKTALAFSDCPVGVDFEACRACETQRIVSRFFHPSELAYLQDKPWDEFFSVWTAKESYVKLIGTGITDDFAAFSVVHAGKIDGGALPFTALQHTDSGVFFRFYAAPAQYRLCICTPWPAVLHCGPTGTPSIPEA